MTQLQKLARIIRFAIAIPLAVTGTGLLAIADFIATGKVHHH